MAKPKNIWQQIKDIVDSGQCPEINLQPEQQLKRVKQNGPGRPANLPEEQNFNHYLGKIRGFKSRPVCYRRGCMTFLRKDQRLCCSEECEKKVLAEINWALSVLKQRPEGIRWAVHNKDVLPDHVKEKMKNAKSRNRRPPRG